MTINIVDAGCGIGKTTALINKINNDTSEQRYIYITPFLSEIERIKAHCPNKNFMVPEKIKGAKYNDIVNLIKNGENIITTHALFKYFTIDIIEEIYKHNYILVMDEVAEVIEEVVISKSDLKILKENYVLIDPNTKLLYWKDKNYNGKFNDYKRMINMKSIYAYTDRQGKIVSLIWMFPYQIFQAFKQIYILTYMFDGQIQKKYFDYFSTKYAYLYVKDFNLTYQIQKYDYQKNRSLINVCENKKYNQIGEDKTSLSLTWFENNKKDLDELKKSIYNFFRSYAKAPTKKTMWTTFKKYKKYVQSKGSIKNFTSINCRATNIYSDRTAVAYIGNRYLKPTIKKFLISQKINISKDFEDRYALSELIQFIYRSAIRNNKPIHVYVPSQRMRELLLKWLKDPN